MNEISRQEKWDRAWLKKAEEFASFSKDPSTKVGAVIVGKENDLVSVGYNGFARKVKDLPERYTNRDIKYKMVVHAEVNAILFADRHRLTGSTLYTWPFICCSNCAAIVIQTGIKRCVAPIISEELKQRWAESIGLATIQFDEAGIETCFY
jgi:dCMP deaminase